MTTTLLKDVDKQCPQCGTHIFASAPRPRLPRVAWIIMSAAIATTALWIFLFITFSPVYVTPRGVGGVILCALIYGWPIYIGALIVWKLPLEVSAKCFKCKWSKTYKIGTPKI